MMLTQFYGRKATEEQKKTFKEFYQKTIRDGTWQYRLTVALGLPIYAAPLGYGSNPYAPFGVFGKAAETAKKKWRGVFPQGRRRVVVREPVFPAGQGPRILRTRAGLQIRCPRLRRLHVGDGAMN